MMFFYCSICSAPVQEKGNPGESRYPTSRKKEPLFSAGASEEDVILRGDLLPTVGTIRCS